MNIAIIGIGYVGATTAVALAEMGWSVTGLDTDERKIEALNGGRLPFFEPGLEEALNRQLRLKRVRFTTDSKEVITSHQIIFICVGTPPDEDGNANLHDLRKVSETIAGAMRDYKLIVNKSTSPVGTQEKMVRWIKDAQPFKVPFDVVSNPEFLREGSALHDALLPDRIVIGSDNAGATGLLKLLFHSMDCPIVVTTPRTAEMIKYAANSFLAAKISFINEMARLCDKINVDVTAVAYGIGLDPRIGKSFLQAGIGYGGSCFPKDLNALLGTAANQYVRLPMLEQVREVNKTQYLYVLERLRSRLGSFQGKTIAVFGISFKPGTDDVRESPALHIVEFLQHAGSSIKVHDPAAKLPESFVTKGVVQCEQPEEAARDADAILLCTDWPDYLQADWARIYALARQPVLLDGRNMLDSPRMQAIGFKYMGVGRYSAG